MKQLNIQDAVLNYSRREHVPVTIYLMNGFQFKGLVCGFDNFTVIIECDGKQQLVYKHAISTITPSKKIDILEILNKSEKDE